MSTHASAALARSASGESPAPRTSGTTTTHWSYVERSVFVHRGPGVRSKRLSRLRTQTPLGSPESVLVLRQKRRGGRGWFLVRYPGVGRRTGWVDSTALSEPDVVHTHVVIDRERRRLDVRYRGRLRLRAAVGVGATASPTPAGKFYVRERLVPTHASGLYGARALGLSAYSPFRTDWPGGGQVGIHGTNQPGLIPGPISNGCVRLRNRDVLRVYRLISVGTPVRIR